MEIKILGTGCSNCRNLEKATREAVAELNLDASVVKEEDIVKIMSYGVMRTPALVVDEKAVLDAIAALVTAPPHSFAPLQSRVAERLGNYAARVSIWASSDGNALGMVTVYEILANEYYLGPKIMIDYVVDRR